jgi:hypothetical protein
MTFPLEVLASAVTAHADSWTELETAVDQFIRGSRRHV